MNEIANAPECQACDGRCCELFAGVVVNDHRPWARRSAEKIVSADNPMWEQVGAPYFDGTGTVIKITCRCLKHTAEGCSIYETRPQACRNFPNPALCSEIPFGWCALLDRIRTEQGVAQG